ncbi:MULTISPECIES: hypothetical protein [unclassified Paenibacillus]|uniref:hypothetical protein n=1 Tax=unclassified Paenibacillus TaxID=185978 RepID=UPI00240616AC|nr:MULTISPECIES: hypothetical protein [unclassified Paenibacillus]MDF9844183.1 hypothetical protein [Paenibacillus sp. PastF-2]MDF9850695.1 hypothetical protein [Paenibacillus sp. PastM-2]MDF9857266.1 hypothetical protein [Paenibacillus sp. PastF-1]MDH6482626.1 hypothetical protein [Paenibacillus sp. PastH-2]MDH6510053.1 hypothetical protein [Paenibacillus sp. PastM-3]
MIVKRNSVEQLELFGGADLSAPAAPEAPVKEVLNGAYYERATDKFVTYVMGRRHKEWSARRCTFSKEWQEKTKKERAI